MQTQIIAQLIKCTTDIIAENGQYLIVVGDCCVGVYDGESGVARQTRKRKAKTYDHEAYKDKIRTVLSKRSATVRELNKRLRITDHNEGGVVGNLVRKMVSEGQLKKVGGERFPVYALVQGD